MRRSHFFLGHTEPRSSDVSPGSLFMSAIRHPKFHISAHADYRRSDHMFSRTQSPTLSQLEWQRPTPRLRSWSEVIVPTLTAAAAMAVALAALY
jgi:hypothetical protein